MLEDRSYMRRESFKPQWSMTLLLLAVNGVVFFLQKLSGGSFNEMLALSNRGLAQGHVWQLLTFQFLHANIIHLLLNLLAIYFFGRLVEERLGKATLLKVYLLSGTIGGLFQISMGALWPEHFRGAVLGASAGAFGLLAAATMLDPDFTILAYFIIPIKAKYFLFLAAGFSILYMVMAPNDETAHAAHLGGLLTGVIYMRWGYLVDNFFDSMRARSASRQMVRASSRRAWGRAKPRRTADLPPEEFISREVDPILDKISSHGIQSLTPQEREILEAARAKMEERS